MSSLSLPGTIPLPPHFDVMLEVVGGTGTNADGTSQLADHPVKLVEGLLWLGPLDDETVRLVQRGAVAGGVNFDRPHPSVRYALVRTVNERDRAGRRYGWCADSLLERAVALSRWIRPTAWSFEYAARVMHRDSDHVEVFPITQMRLGPHAFVEPRLKTDRLTHEDALELRRLLGAFAVAEPLLPERVKRVMFNHEYIRRTNHLNVAWHLVTASIEAFCTTDNGQIGRQFRERLAALASAVGEVGLTTARAKIIWKEIRCAVAHGGEVVTLDEASQLESFSLCMDVLRKALRRCVEEPEFALNFADDAAVQSWCPVGRRR